MGTPSMSPMVTRMNRCSIDARVRRAYRVMSWEAIPYVTSLKRPMNLFRPRGSSGASASRSPTGCSGSCFPVRRGSLSSDMVTSSHAVQVDVVLLGELALPQDASLPGLDLGGH